MLPPHNRSDERRGWRSRWRRCRDAGNDVLNPRSTPSMAWTATTRSAGPRARPTLRRRRQRRPDGGDGNDLDGGAGRDRAVHTDATGAIRSPAAGTQTGAGVAPTRCSRSSRDRKTLLTSSWQPAWRHQRKRKQQRWQQHSKAGQRYRHRQRQHFSCSTSTPRPA